MAPGRPSGCTDVPNDVAALDFITGINRKVEQVSVPRLQAESMVNREEIAVITLIASTGHGAGCGGKDGLASFSRNVEPGMIVSPAGERVATPPRREESQP